MNFKRLHHIRHALLLSPIVAVILWVLGVSWLRAEIIVLDEALAEQNLVLSKQLKVLASKNSAQQQQQQIANLSASGLFLLTSEQGDWAGALQGEIRLRLSLPQVSLNSLEPMEDIYTGKLSWTRAKLVLSAPNDEMLQAIAALGSGKPVLQISEARISTNVSSASDLPPQLMAELVVQSPKFQVLP
jgi:hypothetical protein